MAVTGCVINGNARLIIIAIYVERDTLAVIFDRHSLHRNARGYQISAIKNRRYSIENMVVCFFYIVGNHVLEREHALNIQIPSSCDKVLRIRIFGGKLISDKVASIEISKYLYMSKGCTFL